MMTLPKLFVALLMTTLTPSPQGDWYDCGTIPTPVSIELQTVVDGIPVTVDVEKINPSCPGSQDGKITIVDTHFPPLKSDGISSFEIFTSSVSDFPIANNMFSGLGAGAYRILFQFPGKQFRSFEVKLKEQKTPKLFVRAIGNESCPGAMDGFVILGTSPGNTPTLTDVYWEDLDDYTFARTGLSSGTYPFTYVVDDYFGVCCQDGQISIGNNQCSTTQLVWDFINGIPPGGFSSPPGVLIESDGFAEFSGNGAVTFPIDQFLQAFALVKFYMSGLGSIRAFDQDFQTIAVQSFQGTGYFQLLFQTTVQHFYLEISGQAGTRLKDLCLFGLDAAPEPIQYRLNGPVSPGNALRAMPVDVCLGDTVFAFNGFSVQGGLTPYVYAWDTDDDGQFDNGDSLNVPLVFAATGMHSVHLAVSDLAAQSDTLEFQYNVLAPDTMRISIADLGIANEAFAVLSVCGDQGAFEIEVLNASGMLSSDSPGLNGNTFDPAAAGNGDHYIAVTGDACAANGGVFVHVDDTPDAAFEPLPDLYTCDPPVNLAAFVTGDTAGLWTLDGQYAILNDTLDPALLDAGAHVLSYTIGDSPCRDSTGQELTILPAPVADLDAPAQPLQTDDDPFDLNQLLGSSTPGGSWSGGAYINGDMFDPSGLAMGTYPAIYTVGQQTCTVSDTIYIEVEEVSSVSVQRLSDFFTVSPNPTSGMLKFCSRSEVSDYQIALLALDGKPQPVRWVKTDRCWWADLSESGNGVYLLQVTDRATGQAYSGKV
ncbi:MAG: hypothetical protein R3330_05090, partial [Saprospiraceae bacterium]|nr:hypothetical protein [Saprospiraceae bacterium]